MKTTSPRSTPPLIPHTINGETVMIEDPDAVQIKVPRDWDRIVLGAIMFAAVVAVLASMGWTTASIGDLLARAVIRPIAYGAAAVFDIAWIACLGAEWLCRYDPARARLPRAAGHWALGVAMVAVAIHGKVNGSLMVGLVGAVVSALAKGVWMIAIHLTAKPLDPRTQRWVERKSAGVAAQLAMLAINRQLARAQAGIPASERTVITTAEEGSQQSHAAIVHALTTMPEATPEEIAAQLALIGMTVSPDTVRSVSGSSPDWIRTQPGFGPGSGSTVRTLPLPGTVTITDTVRTLVGAGVIDPDQVVAIVRATHGAQVSEETVLRTLRKLLRPAGAGP